MQHDPGLAVAVRGKTTARSRALDWVPCGYGGVKAGSFSAEPFAHGGFRPGAILGAQVGQGFVERGVALSGGFRDQVPFEGLNLVDRRTLSARQHAREAVLGDRIVLSGRLAQQRYRSGFVLWRAGSVK